MNDTKLYPIHAGFLPLLDAAILVVAKDKGFAASEGIDLTLVRETSWASIRDRMAVGHFEVAHMLAPMPVAAQLGLSPIKLDIVAPMAMGLGGNAVTVSNDLAKDMALEGDATRLDAAEVGQALKTVVEARKASGETSLRFAVVHPHSGHNYELRYWMSGVGINPDEDVEIIVVPPPLMPDAMATGRIDGFCVGEPWNTMATMRGTGQIITTKAAIWRSSPEKVLAVSRQFAEEQADKLDALMRALYHTANWCGKPENREELANILASPNRIGVAAKYILPALSGDLVVQADRLETVDDFFMPFDRAATFPWKSHALWFYSQMVRWGHAVWNPSDVEQVSQAYRTDLYRRALDPLGVPVPAASSKVEGALPRTEPVGAGSHEMLLGPDGFFDGMVFDPDQIEAYLDSQRD